MSEAKVEFETIEFNSASLGEEAYYSFQCPKHNRRCGSIAIRGRTGKPHDPQGKNGGEAQWGWDGDRLAPTFTPSVNCKGCWHGYIQKGRCVDTSGRDEP